MIKLFLHSGHGGTDTGAVRGLKIERDINRDILFEMKRIIERDYSKSIKLYIMRETLDNTTHGSILVTDFANSLNLDLALDIHCNSGGGLGFECYVGKSGLCNSLGNLFTDCMSDIGVNIRGVKTRLSDSGNDFYYFIRNLKCPSMILETCFLDNDKDIDMTKEKNIIAVANAYVRAIVTHFQIQTDKIANSDLTKEQLYHVQCGAFKNKESAEALKSKLESFGFDTYITKY